MVAAGSSDAVSNKRKGPDGVHSLIADDDTQVRLNKRPRPDAPLSLSVRHCVHRIAGNPMGGMFFGEATPMVIEIADDEQIAQPAKIPEMPVLYPGLVRDTRIPNAITVRQQVHYVNVKNATVEVEDVGRILNEIKARTVTAIDIEKKVVTERTLQALRVNYAEGLKLHSRHACGLTVHQAFPSRTEGVRQISTEVVTVKGGCQNAGRMTFSQEKFYEKMTSKVYASQLAYTDPLPRYQSWIMLAKNYPVEDEKRLHHLPYFGEDVDLSNIVEFYNVTGHKGSDDEDGSGAEKEEPEEGAEINDDDLTYHDCLNIVTVGDLYGVNSPHFKILVVQLGRKRNVVALYEHLKKILCGETEQPIIETKDVNELMDTFRTLFCRRCYIFDCRLHHLDNNTQPNHANVMRSAEQHQDPGEWEGGCVCPDESKVLIEAMRTDEWSAIDKVMYEKARTLSNIVKKEGGDNVKTSRRPDCCFIAQMVATKTCTQVREYADANPWEEEQEEPQDTDATAKKKRKGAKAFSTKSRKRYATTMAKQLQNDPNIKKALFSPCSHAGACTVENGCSCANASPPRQCEKFCLCDKPQCGNRVQGCTCKKNHCRKRSCPCFADNRECDPDLCVTCHACTHPSELRNPADRLCENVSVQTGVHKHLLMGVSDVAGWGIFAKTKIDKKDFIHEYKGEIITNDEAERRGNVFYDRMRLSFLFDLNSELVVDATRKGNKTKFANHNSAPNCFCKIVRVNGDDRICLFAKNDILAGEELFFDYTGMTGNRRQECKFPGIESAYE